ncbi:PP2C family protein-serine/threonine phosphatase [Paramaledivibacter caminithermalis]|uniref:Serine phosphatase RsbU, regulator of sigma subunit n=1 Tax=Paramaledivibacter caminithermalis (strain DSM 15212 / CIP 107654 / DViRD3) TaxID=1121301 RepID=A0A1M6NDM3_PARC5|nr:PP2C family protein-serine/threonine phosphatase [Paramaledivibacter caminithermalis]SHJ93852.1 Serine phosphatase RsbU, regulator of sigma subunit [Paramaledivibacter caminithermalis DSM 15212]
MEIILTKKLERQKRFTEDILAGMIDLVRVVDKNNRIIFINKPMEDLIGDVRGEVCYRALGKRCKCETCITETTIKYGKVVKKEEIIGNKIFSVVSSPIRDENGEIYCAVEVFRDVTEKKEMEKIILKQNLKMRKDLDFAKKIQQRIIPKDGIYNNIIKIYSKYIPSEMLGGDVFDIIDIDEENIGIYMADVAGHGVTASMITMFIRQTLKNLKTDALDSVYTLNYLKSRYKELHLDDNYYITILYGVFNKSSFTIKIVNGGHNCMPIVFRQDKVEEVFLPGLPICTLFDDIGYNEYNLQLNSGDRILFYTDGISEARNIQKEIYSDRILEICLENKSSSSDILIQRIIDDARDFSNNNLDDDVAMMMMEVL